MITSVAGTPMGRRILFCRKVAVADVVLVVVVVAKIVGVTVHCLHIGFVEHCTEDGVVYVWCGMECMLDDVGRGAPPFHDQNEAVDQRRCRADVDNRCERR